MKVDKNSVNPSLLNLAQKVPKQNPNEPIDCACNTGSIDTDSASCASRIGKAQVLMQNKHRNHPESDEEILRIINDIVKHDGMQVGRFIRGGKSISIGTPVEGFKGIVHDDVRAKCIKNEDGTLKEIYFLRNSDGSVEVFDENANLKKQFFPREMKALYEYKYHPESVHTLLRKGVHRGIDSQETIEGWIDTISSIYKNDSKIWKTDKPITVYRALPQQLSEEQIKNLSAIGGIFEEKSFSSTTTSLDIAKRFCCGNPILEIELPKGSKYIDMDLLFNIDREHWREQEFLLDKDGKFVIKGFDKENNIVKVSYMAE